MAKTPKLADLQLILLSTAAARDDGNVFPVKGCIKDKTAEIATAITPLLTRALVVEQPETVLVRVWRKDTDQRIGLAITDAGRALIDGGGQTSGVEIPAIDGAADPAPAPRVTKAAMVLGLLQRDDGAILPELIAATGWLPHTTRAALTGLRKKGHAIDKSRRDDATCYRIAMAA